MLSPSFVFVLVIFGILFGYLSFQNSLSKSIKGGKFIFYPIKFLIYLLVSSIFIVSIYGINFLVTEPPRIYWADYKDLVFKTNDYKIGYLKLRETGGKVRRTYSYPGEIDIICLKKNDPKCIDGHYKIVPDEEMPRRVNGIVLLIALMIFAIMILSNKEITIHKNKITKKFELPFYEREKTLEIENIIITGQSNWFVLEDAAQNLKITLAMPYSRKDIEKIVKIIKQTKYELIKQSAQKRLKEEANS